MFIIIEGKNGTRCRLKGVFLVILLFAILVFVAAASRGVWYFYQNQAASLVSVVSAQTVEHWEAILSKQQAALMQIKKQANAVNKSLARRVGSLQAGLLRLETLGIQVKNAMGEKEINIDFSIEPALGGPEGEQHTDVYFRDLMDDMSEELMHRQAQLTLLNELLRQQQQESDAIPSGRPVLKGQGWLSSKYGRRIDPFSGEISMHKGVDFAGRIGWPVVATGAGVVIYAGHRNSYGLLVEINHGNGYVTRYGHHDKLQVVAGDIIESGVVIGNMGNSGRSTGPHVHYEVLKDGKHINPKHLFGRRF